MKFKMQVKVNFTVAERYHYHHATRAHQQQSRPRVSLQHGGVEAVRKQAASKRATKGKRPARESVEAKDEIIVQRMSSEVTGKQQKYTRIGPREFVPFEFDDITFHNKVESCQKYFAAQIDKDMICDVLAGERGPSCKKMSQIPDHKVFYVRFIEMSDAEVSNDQDEEEHEQQMHKVCDNT